MEKISIGLVEWGVDDVVSWPSIGFVFLWYDLAGHVDFFHWLCLWYEVLAFPCCMELWFCFYCCPSLVDFTSNIVLASQSFSYSVFLIEGSEVILIQWWPIKHVNVTPGWFCLGWYQSCTTQGRLQSVQMVKTGGELSHWPGWPGMQVAQPELSLGVWGCHRQAGIWDTHLAGIAQGCAAPARSESVGTTQVGGALGFTELVCKLCTQLGLWV